LEEKRKEKRQKKGGDAMLWPLIQGAEEGEKRRKRGMKGGKVARKEKVRSLFKVFFFYVLTFFLFPLPPRVAVLLIASSIYKG